MELSLGFSISGHIDKTCVFRKSGMEAGDGVILTKVDDLIEDKFAKFV